MPANATDDLVEIGMEQRFAAAQRHDARAQSGQSIDAPKQVGGRNWRRVVVVLVAVRARQVAAPDGDEMGVDGLVREPECPDQHSDLAEAPLRFSNTLHHSPLSHGSTTACQPSETKTYSIQRPARRSGRATPDRQPDVVPVNSVSGGLTLPGLEPFVPTADGRGHRVAPGGQVLGARQPRAVTGSERALFGIVGAHVMRARPEGAVTTGGASGPRFVGRDVGARSDEKAVQPRSDESAPRPLRAPRSS